MVTYKAQKLNNPNNNYKCLTVIECSAGQIPIKLHASCSSKISQ